jgi:hypothetical protein
MLQTQAKLSCKMTLQYYLTVAMQERQSWDTVLFMAELIHFNAYLKGQCHEIFDPRFSFHQTIPPISHGLKPFRVRLRIRRENRVGSRHENFLN